MIRLIMSVILMLFISACGKTGALYLPDVEKADDVVKTPAESSLMNNEETDRGSL
ncbi:MAG: hypothetical protein OEY06_09550 [Gammaproteobacteria bacterium]|nr:hypothetical protein [Gammaproteobacteria bacterium]